MHEESIEAGRDALNHFCRRHFQHDSRCPEECRTPSPEDPAKGDEARARILAEADRPKVGRPKGFDGTRSRSHSAMAQAFKKAGLDWQADFARAIMATGDADARRRAWGRERVKLWLRLLPYMIVTGHRRLLRGSKLRGRPSAAARRALEEMERETGTRLRPI